jgi:hypothetical protein
LGIHKTYNIRTTNISTSDSPRERRIKDIRKAFVSTMGKENTSPATAFRKQTIIVTLEKETISEQDASKEAHSGEH